MWSAECGMERPMKRNLKITNEPIAEASLFAHRQSSDAAGAVIYFLGIVRGIEESAPIAAIEYETFQKMAEHQFHLLFDQIDASDFLGNRMLDLNALIDFQKKEIAVIIHDEFHGACVVITSRLAQAHRGLTQRLILLRRECR